MTKCRSCGMILPTNGIYSCIKNQCDFTESSLEEMLAKPPKPVEGDVREEAVRVIKGTVMWYKYGASELRDIPPEADYWSSELARRIYGALLSKFYFTRKG